MFENKTLMITGGTGSFGQTVLRRFLRTSVKNIHIFSRDEKKQEDLRNELNDEKLKFFIGDVRDYRSVRDAMTGVDYVFHAAALKQVPSCEFYPMEALRTNVIGTENVIQAAISANVGRVVILSTDKAVYPINAMGISKAMAEKVAVAKSRLIENGPIVAITRYGNVMASRGSVIPLFINQIKSGQPITITDKNMTRFLMSLDESVDLVLYAYKNSNQGDIFIQKAPSARIEDLAEAIKQLFSSDVPVKTIGTRHGEKLYETLVAREEMAKSVDLDGYYQIPADNRSLNYNKYFFDGEERISDFDDYTSHNTKILSVDEIKDKLLTLSYVRDELKGKVTT